MPLGVDTVFKPEVEQFEIKTELIRYVLCQIVIASIITFFFILNRHELTLEIKTALVFFIGWTLVSATLHYDHLNALLLFHEATRLVCIMLLTLFLYFNHLIQWYFAAPTLAAMVAAFVFIPKPIFKSSNGV